MIQDHTIDQTLIELARTMKALKALRAIRKRNKNPTIVSRRTEVWGGQPADVTNWSRPESTVSAHAAATRASMDLTRKLADLRCGR